VRLPPTHQCVSVTPRATTVVHPSLLQHSTHRISSPAGRPVRFKGAAEIRLTFLTRRLGERLAATAAWQ